MAATAAVRPIVRAGLIDVPGSGRCAPSLVVWRYIGSYDGAWRRSSRCNGSPEQISGWLKQEFPTHQDMRISHEAIYRSLFIQTRGVLKKELTAQLRTARRMRRPKSHNVKSGQGHILDMVSICERPAEIEDRAVPGHWEGDLLTGANDTHIATLVERNTRFTMLVKIPRKDTTTVVAA